MTGASRVDGAAEAGGNTFPYTSSVAPCGKPSYPATLALNHGGFTDTSS